MQHTGTLSRIFEIDRTTLNYYVKRGLVHPRKEGNQYHAYGFSDFVALAYLRHYLGLGFHTEEIGELLAEGDISQQLSLLKERQQSLQKEEKQLRLKSLYLQNLQSFLSFIRDEPPLRLSRQSLTPYYFFPKEDIPEDSLWMELYRTLPSLEFRVPFSSSQGFVIPSLENSSGVSIKTAWLEELELTPPQGGIFYPGGTRYVSTFSLQGERMEEELDKHLSEVCSLLPPDAPEEKLFILYLFLTSYGKREPRFDCLCFLNSLTDE